MGQMPTIMIAVDERREEKVPSNTPNEQLGPVAPGSSVGTRETDIQDQGEYEEEEAVGNLPCEAVQSGPGGESQCPVSFSLY